MTMRRRAGALRSFNFTAATDEGLTVPVLKDVDRLTVRQLAGDGWLHRRPGRS
jgi:hypothetical protein